MATPDTPIPAKIKDAIVEAIVEIRFETKTVPEILIGRLADYEPWRGYQQRKLPMYEIPAALRQIDPNLRYQTVFELREPTGKRCVRIGPEALSCHQFAPYIGWTDLRPQLNEAIDVLFDRAEPVLLQRLGLRYINALRSDVHGIGSITDLDLTIEVATVPLAGNATLAFSTEPAANMRCTVRIATPDFVTGAVPENTTVLIDVDVFTKTAPGAVTRDVAKDWVRDAHEQEKKNFFRLLKNSTIDALKES